MNYFEKIEKAEHILTKELKQYPIVWQLCFDYVEKNVLVKESTRPVQINNPFRADFQGTRDLWRPKFLAKSLFYNLLKAQTGKKQNVLLLSNNLSHRFPQLTEKLIKNHNCLMPVTKTSVMFAKKTPEAPFLKVDDTMYTPPVERGLAVLMPVIRNHVLQDSSFSVTEYRDLLAELEAALGAIVENLAIVIKANNVTQYICPYCNRYEEILICLACKKLGIPSKEICHGVNSHKLINSDNVVPTYADFLYVWNQQFYDNISLFEDLSRIKICGYPKFDAESIARFKRQYPTRKLITYFSQATYDVGSRTDQVLEEDFVKTESAWRQNLFSTLKQIKDQQGYQVRIRYHQGEKLLSPGCDRTAERAALLAMGFEISDNPLEQDLFESELCLGINSSTLFEAYVAGRNAIQLYFAPAGSDNYHNVAPVIQVSEIAAKLKATQNRDDEPKSGLLFNLDWFLADEVSA